MTDPTAPEVDHHGGAPDISDDGRRLVRRILTRIVVAVALTNVVGATVVFAFAVWVLPPDPVPHETAVVLVNLVATCIWVPVAIAIASVWHGRSLLAVRRWIDSDRQPTPEEQRAVLGAPTRVFRVQVTLWLFSAVVYATANGIIAPRLITRVGFTIALVGLSTSAIAFLITERLLRPVAARVLAAGEVDRTRLPGITARHVLAWALGTAVPVLGLVISGLFSLVEQEATVTSTAITMIVLGSVALVVGLWTTVLGARSIADPVHSVQAGMTRVRDGDLDVTVPVYDGSELGLLQDGFNQMVEGLRERERIRDVFGRHVGADVAAGALEGQPSLGGDLRSVAVLFVDIIGSTRLAVELPPTEVVDLLNRFFAVVVATVDAHHGWINKFEGDAALAVFGAFGERTDPAGSALATARHLDERLAAAVPELRAGIGVAAGDAVAGNIGAEHRFEYTVIGDPVNAAARLSELAKAHPVTVLASGEAVAAADGQEAQRWEQAGEVTLRGRTTATHLFRPR